MLYGRQYGRIRSRPETLVEGRVAGTESWGEFFSSHEWEQFSSYTVPEETMRQWLPRRTQTVLVELFAAVLAQRTGRVGLDQRV